MNENEKSKLKLILCNRDITKKDLIKITIEMKICIKLITYKNHENSDKTTKVVYIGDKNNKIFEIGLLDEHYFINEKTIYCKNDLFKTNSKKNYDTNLLTSYQLINLLLQNKEKFLKKIDNVYLLETYFYDKFKNNYIEYINDDDDNFELIENKDKKEKENFINVFFDFETYCNNENKHIAYLVCIQFEINKLIIKKSFYGPKCGLIMLDYLSQIKKNVILIAHNAKYDYKFIYEYLIIISELVSDGIFYSCEAIYKNMKIQIKDSYKLISSKLSDFNKMFNLGDNNKELMNYDFYNEENINKKYCNIEQAMINFDEDEKIHFKKNIQLWNLSKDNITYDIIEYSNQYCMIDCDILMKGYNIFKKWINDDFNINIDNYLTISSVAHQYILNEKCYEECYKNKGIVKEFIQQCIIGGRVMMQNNKKRHIENTDIIDNDAVSLYPSSMYLFNGFLKGKAKIIKQENLNYEFLKNQDGYFVEIIIIKNNVYRSFPLMNYKNEEIRQFSNEMENKTIYVDNYTLEDLIEHHKIEYKLIKGYYYNDGFNTKIKNTISYLFNKRVELKKEKNGAELIYKLIMNSIYGKTIMKSHNIKTKIFNSKIDATNVNTYIKRHCSHINQIIKLGENKIKIELHKSISNESNINHIGCNILSYSKRLMNNVICLAENNDIEIFYQDTDSLHMKKNDIEKLENLYYNKYNKLLTGTGLGQFHSDFPNNSISKEFIMLGKKSYCNTLQYIKNDKIITDYHIRMKGIPNNVINKKCKDMNITPIQLYKKLYDREEIEFDLLSLKPKFKFNSDYSINTMIDFKRKIKF